MTAQRTIILIGAPGAGKTSQAAAISSALKATSVSPGQLLRDLKGDTVIGNYMQQFFLRDALAEIAWEFIERGIAEAKTAGCSLVLEGTPKAPPDTLLLQRRLSKYGLAKNVQVIVLDISPQDVAARLKKNPRAGRESEDMTSRHKKYEQETGPLLKALAEQGLSPITVDANASEEEVTKRILDVLKTPGVNWEIKNNPEAKHDVADKDLRLVAQPCDAIETAECVMRLISHSSLDPLEVGYRKRLDAVQRRKGEPPKFPGSQCNGLQQHHLDPRKREYVDFRNYKLTPKADGTRYLVVVVHSASGPRIRLIDRNLHAYRCLIADKPEGKEDGPGSMKNEVSILDAELVRSKDSHVMLLTFDCLCVRNKSIINQSLQNRLDAAQTLVTELREEGYIADKSPSTVEIIMKNYEDGANLSSEKFDSLVSSKTHPFSSDGLILTPKGGYRLGFDNTLLKWKPSQEFTADFRARKVSGPHADPNNSGEQCILFEVYAGRGGLDMSYGNNNFGYLIVGLQTAQDIDEKVVELAWDAERSTLVPDPDGKPNKTVKGGWVFKRLRSDKPRPNDISVIGSIVDAIRQPELMVTLETLKQAILSNDHRDTARGDERQGDDDNRGGDRRGGGREESQRGGRGGRGYGDNRGGYDRSGGDNRGGYGGDNRGGYGGDNRGGYGGDNRGGYDRSGGSDSNRGGGYRGDDRDDRRGGYRNSEGAGGGFHDREKDRVGRGDFHGDRDRDGGRGGFRGDRGGGDRWGRGDRGGRDGDRDGGDRGGERGGFRESERGGYRDSGRESGERGGFRGASRDAEPTRSDRGWRDAEGERSGHRDDRFRDGERGGFRSGHHDRPGFRDGERGGGFRDSDRGGRGGFRGGGGYRDGPREGDFRGDRGGDRGFRQERLPERRGSVDRDERSQPERRGSIDKNVPRKSEDSGVEEQEFRSGKPEKAEKDKEAEDTRGKVSERRASTEGDRGDRRSGGDRDRNRDNRDNRDRSDRVSGDREPRSQPTRADTGTWRTDRPAESKPRDRPDREPRGGDRDRDSTRPARQERDSTRADPRNDRSSRDRDRRPELERPEKTERNVERNPKATTTPKKDNAPVKKDKDDNIMSVLAVDSDSEQDEEGPEGPDVGEKDSEQESKNQRRKDSSRSNNSESAVDGGENKSETYYVGVSRKESAVQPLLDWHNAIKRDMYNRHLPFQSTVLELAGGRGGDLWKIMSRKPREILLVDVDEGAIAEARKRWDAKYGSGAGQHSILQLQKCELRTKAAFLTGAGSPFDFVSCHFALHYFWESAQTWAAFLQTLQSSVRPGGLFIATLFDGDKVAELLKASSDGSVAFCNSALVLARRHDAEGSVAIHLPQSEESDFGRAISVKVDTIGTHVEYLVSIPALIKRMESQGWELVESQPFATCLNSAPFARTAGLSPMASAEMKAFSALNIALAFRRKASKVVA